MIKTPSELVQDMRQDNNQIWDRFVAEYAEQVIKDFHHKGILPTPEVFDQELRKVIADNASPTFVIHHHVFKCRHCPKYHTIISPALLIETDRAEPDSPVLTNVALAFPVECLEGEEDFDRFSVTSFKELQIVKTTKGNSEFGLVDPKYFHVIGAEQNPVH